MVIGAPIAKGIKLMSYQDFFDGYVSALLWSEVPMDENDNDPTGWGNFEWATEDDFAPGEWQKMAQDCQSFYENYHPLFNGNDDQAGHDFALTRNGHGAGFWDGDWPDDVGDKLTEACRPYGSQNLMMDNDEKVYVL